jgi:hypothetical protein
MGINKRKFKNRYNLVKMRNRFLNKWMINKFKNKYLSRMKKISKVQTRSILRFLTPKISRYLNFSRRIINHLNTWTTPYLKALIMKGLK